MPAVSVRLTLAAGLLLAPAPALAVGFGPLIQNGSIDGPREGFRFDLLNSDADVGEFNVYAIGYDDEQPQTRVSIFPAQATLGGNRARKVLVIADELAVGETYQFRVCAERKPPSEGIMIHARVCSKITARRID